MRSLSASTSVSGKTKAPKKAGKATVKKVVKTDDLISKSKTPSLDIVEEKSTAIKTSSKELKSKLKVAPCNTVLSKTMTLHGRPLTSFTVIDLKAECAVRGLTKSGKKQDLVERLEQYILKHEISDIDKFATGAVKTDDLEIKSKTPILDIVEEKLTVIKTSSNELKSVPKVAKKAVKKAVKTDDLESKSKTPILDIVEEKLTAIKTSNKELKVAIKIAPENASTETTKTATSQAIQTKTSAAKNVEKKTEETIVSEKPRTDAPTKNTAENFPFSSIKIEEDAKKVANEEKVEKEAEEKTDLKTDLKTNLKTNLKAKKDSKENADIFLHKTVHKFALPGLNLGFFFGLFASFCLSLPFSFFLKNRKKPKPKLR